MSFFDIDWSKKPNELDIFLAKPDKTTIAKLSEATDKANQIKLGGINELRLSVPYFVEIDGELQVNPHVKLIKDRYLLRAELVGSKEWYVIRGIDESMENDEVTVTAYLLPYEMTDKLLRNLTFESVNLATVMNGGIVPDGSGGSREINGVLGVSNWQLAYVDSKFDLLYRDFDISSKTLLDFIFEVAETFNALILWDTINRRISFVDPENSGRNNKFTISDGQYLDNIVRKVNSDDMTTRFKVEGKDGLSIQRLTPNGQNYLEDYSFFLYPFQRDTDKNVISHSDYMSDSLCNALLDYRDLTNSKLPKEVRAKTGTTENNIVINDHGLATGNYIENITKRQIRKITVIDSDNIHIDDTIAGQGEGDLIRLYKQDSFGNYIFQMEELNNQLSALEIQLATLNEELDVLQNLVDVKNATGQNPSQAISDRDAKKMQVNQKQTEINNKNSEMASVQTNIDNLRSVMSMENNFTLEQVKELNQFIVEKEWVDQNYFDDRDLYEEAQKRFEQIKAPSVVADVDIIDLFKLVEAQKDWNKLRIGDTVRVKYSRMDIFIETKIIEIDVNYDNDTISLTIANVSDIKSGEEKLIKMLYNSISTSTTVDLNKWKWNEAPYMTSLVNELINNRWDAIKQEIVAGVNESVEIGKRGIIIKDPNDPNRYLVAQHGVLAITNDGGNTWKHAITAEGIIGERIFGKLIAGVNLEIDASDKNGTSIFRVNGDGVQVIGSSLTVSGGLTSDHLNSTLNNKIDNSLQQGSAYNGTVIDAANGLVVTKSDNKIRSILNATNGISIQYRATLSDSWTDRFSVNAITGQLIAEELVANKLIMKNGNDVLIDASTRTIDLTKFNTILGKLSASSIEIRGTTIRNGSNVVTFAVDNSGNLTIAGNINMMGGTISWSNVVAPDYVYITGTKPPSNADNTDVKLLGNGFTKIGANYIYTSSITAEQITGGIFKALNKITIGDPNSTTSSRTLEWLGGCSITNVQAIVGGAWIGLKMDAYSFFANTQNVTLGMVGNVGTVSINGVLDLSGVTSVVGGNALVAKFG